ncbi:MAG: HD domain-containing protein [Candidatus Anstonellales archaeon]
MNRERQIYLLTVASLLHDIGKAFLKIGGSIPEELDAFINERYNGKKYHHYLGAALVEIACNSTNLSDEHKEDLLIISKLIRGHHELQGTDWSEKNEFYNEIINGTDEELKKLLKILIKADHMSARERDISNTEFPESETNDTHISEDKKNSDKLLKPIFPLEDLSKIKNPEPLLIGYESFDFNRETKPTANEVYQSIKKHLMNYNRKAGWVQTLLYILKEYTFFIQSYKQSKAPHISLYSHSITTAAIASSLIFSGIHGPIAVVWLKLGGLQNFINMLEDKDFKGKGGSKVLRGRSKYIETLTYEIVYKITTYCGLTPANAVMISSGKALLLLPTSEVNKASEVLQNYRRLLLLDLRIDLLKLGMGSSNLTDINKDGSGFDEIIKQAIIKA